MYIPARQRALFVKIENPRVCIIYVFRKVLRVEALAGLYIEVVCFRAMSVLTEARSKNSRIMCHRKKKRDRRLLARMWTTNRPTACCSTAPRRGDSDSWSTSRALITTALIQTSSTRVGAGLGYMLMKHFMLIKENYSRVSITREYSRTMIQHFSSL